MSTKILAATKYTFIDTATGSFPTVMTNQITATKTVTDRVLALNVTALSSPGTNTTRGFYFGVGGKHHRLIYSFDYKFEPTTNGQTATTNSVNFEGSTKISLTWDSEWKHAEGIFTRPTYTASYSAFVFYHSSTSFTLGTYYLRNLKLESIPWVFTINGQPVTVTV